ncbi:MAG: PEGA domain-containing protein [Proteobacteria bacterium]|nr:PEGA domain-containing protein [Pseudomonadota bacterium]
MPRRLACLILLLLSVVPAAADVFEDAPAAKPPAPAAPVTQPDPGLWGNTAGGDAATLPPLPTAPVPAPPQAPAKVKLPPKPPAPAVSPAVLAAEQAEIERRRQAQLDYTQALDEFNAGRYAKAAELLQRHLAVFPEHGQARGYLEQARRLERAQTHGVLRVLCRPPGQVYLDGRAVGRTPLSLPEVPVGRHLVEVAAGGLRQGRTLDVKGMTTVTVEFDLGPHAPEAPQAPATGAYQSRVLGLRLTPPAGWRIKEDSAKRQLQLLPPEEGFMLQVNANPLAQGVDLEGFVRRWDETLLTNTAQPLRRKVKDAPMRVGGRQGRLGVYQGQGSQATVVFLEQGGRVYLFSSICLPQSCPQADAALWRLLESFSPLP